MKTRVSRSNSALARYKIEDDIIATRGPYTNKTVSVEKIWEEIEDISKSTYSKMHAFRNLYSWAVPSKEIIKKISDLVESHPNQKFISIGAGLGLWERLVYEEIKNKKEHEVIALEINEALLDKSPENTYYPLKKGKANHANLIKIDPDNNSVLFICWPYKDTMLDAILKYKPNYIIYIGETDPEGQNEGEAFFNELNSNHHYGHMYDMPIKQWEGVNDVIKFYMCTI